MQNLVRFEAETRLVSDGKTRWVRAVLAPEPHQDGSVTFSGIVLEANAGQITQVVMNLVMNGAEAIGAGGACFPRARRWCFRG